MIYDLVYVFAVVVFAAVLWALLQRSPADDEIKRWGLWAILAVAVIIIMVILLRLLMGFAAQGIA